MPRILTIAGRLPALAGRFLRTDDAGCCCGGDGDGDTLPGGEPHHPWPTNGYLVMSACPGAQHPCIGRVLAPARDYGALVRCVVASVWCDSSDGPSSSCYYAFASAPVVTEPGAGDTVASPGPGTCCECLRSQSRLPGEPRHCDSTPLALEQTVRDMLRVCPGKVALNAIARDIAEHPDAVRCQCCCSPPRVTASFHDYYREDYPSGHFFSDETTWTALLRRAADGWPVYLVVRRVIDTMSGRDDTTTSEASHEACSPPGTGAVPPWQYSHGLTIDEHCRYTESASYSITCDSHSVSHVERIPGLGLCTHTFASSIDRNAGDCDAGCRGAPCTSTAAPGGGSARPPGCADCGSGGGL